MKLVEFINEAIDHPDEPLWINPERVGAVYASDREDVTVIAIGRSIYIVRGSPQAVNTKLEAVS